MDIYKLLEKTNCGECGLPTCMAFALSAVAGEKEIDACPHLNPEDRERLAGELNKRLSEEGFSASVNDLRERFRKLDLPALAQRLGAKYTDGKLTIRCLVKDFSLNKHGEMESICHVNMWMETLLLSYCLSSGTGSLSDRWAAFPELHGAATTGPYFQRRCETPLRAMADTHGSIFFDLLKLFGAEEAQGFVADRALIMHPLPMVPIVLLYSPQEEEMESTLRVLFDSTVTDYLDPEVITFMGRGMVEMFQKIISKHEGCLPDLLAL
jgi:hypothetical protein